MIFTHEDIGCWIDGAGLRGRLADLVAPFCPDGRVVRALRAGSTDAIEDALEWLAASTDPGLIWMHRNNGIYLEEL